MREREREISETQKRYLDTITYCSVTIIFRCLSEHIQRFEDSEPDIHMADNRHD